MGCLFSTNKLFLVLSRTSFSSVHGTDFWWVLISDALFSSHCCFQNKCYPKDSAKDALCKGRVRVQLKQSDNSFFNEKFQSSKWCLVVVIEHLTSAQLVTLAGIFLYNNAVILFFFAFDRESIISISWWDDPQIKKSSEQIFTKWQFKSTARSWSKLQEEKRKERKRKMKQTCFISTIIFVKLIKKCLCTCKSVYVRVYFIPFNHMLNVKVHNVWTYITTWHSTLYVSMSFVTIHDVAIFIISFCFSSLPSYIQYICTHLSTLSTILLPWIHFPDSSE